MRESDFSRGPEIVAEVFKTFAWLVLVLGLAGALIGGIELSRNSGLTNGQVLWVSIGIAVGAIFWSALIAFFGYVLELLVDIRNATDASALAAVNNDED